MALSNMSALAPTNNCAKTPTNKSAMVLYNSSAAALTYGSAVALTITSADESDYDKLTSTEIENDWQRFKASKFSDDTFLQEEALK